MSEDPGQLEAQRLELRAHLAQLDSESLSELLTRARLDVLGFVASGAGIARRVLLIEEASQCLLETFPLEDPTALDDARTIRTSSVRALDQMIEVLDLLREWLAQPPAEPQGAERAVRTLLHAFSNVLVGINCYAELLTSEIQEGDPCHGALSTICQEGADISRIVRERATLQRHLNEIFQAPLGQACMLERQALAILASNLGVSVPSDEEGEAELDAAAIAQTLAELPPAEGWVLRETLRRLGVSVD